MNIINIDRSKRFNWFVWSKELPTKCVVKAHNPWEAINEAIKLHPCIKTTTCVIPEDDDIELKDEWDIPSEGWVISDK